MEPEIISNLQITYFFASVPVYFDFAGFPDLKVRPARSNQAVASLYTRQLDTTTDRF